MSDFELPDMDGDIGLGDEDKGKVQSKNVDWYKPEAGRTDRIALVMFNTLDVKLLRQAVAQKPDITDEQKRAVLVKARAQLAEKLGKTPDALEQLDLLDTSEARFKVVTASYKDKVGYSPWPKSLTPAEESVWMKAGEKTDHVCTVILQYPTDREGDVERERLKTGWRVMPWRFGSDKYIDLRKIAKGLAEGGDSITKVDLHITAKSAKGRFVPYNITQAGPSIYNKNEAFRRLVLEKALTIYEKAMNPFKPVTTEELREKLGLGPATGSGGGGGDFSNEDFSNVLGTV